MACARCPAPRGHDNLLPCQALETVKLQPHLAPCIEHIDSLGLRRAIITRNGPHAVDHFLLASSLQFEKIVTRDFLPCKPAGDPLLHVAESFGVDPARTLMVGDSKDDLACGRAAGAYTVLLLVRSDRFPAPRCATP